MASTPRYNACRCVSVDDTPLLGDGTPPERVRANVGIVAPGIQSRGAARDRPGVVVSRRLLHGAGSGPCGASQQACAAYMVISGWLHTIAAERLPRLLRGLRTIGARVANRCRRCLNGKVLDNVMVATGSVQSARNNFLHAHLVLR